MTAITLVLEPSRIIQIRLSGGCPGSGQAFMGKGDVNLQRPLRPGRQNLARGIGVLAVMAALLLGHWAFGQRAVAAHTAADRPGGNLVVLVTEQKQVWINCRAMGANQSLPVTS